MPSFEDKQAALSGSNTSNFLAEAMVEFGKIPRRIRDAAERHQSQGHAVGAFARRLDQTSRHKKMHTRECCIEAYMQFLNDGERSGKHRHMWEELFFVVEGSGYDLHWDLKWDCLEAFDWEWAEEPKKFEWTRGDYVYIPPFTHASAFRQCRRGMPHHRDEQSHRQRHGLRLVRPGRARAGILMMRVVRRLRGEQASGKWLRNHLTDLPFGRHSTGHRRGLSMRGYLFVMVMAILLPVLLFAAILFWRYYDSEARAHRAGPDKPMRGIWRRPSTAICKASWSRWKRWRRRTRSLVATTIASILRCGEDPRSRRRRRPAARPIRPATHEYPRAVGHGRCRATRRKATIRSSQRRSHISATSSSEPWRGGRSISLPSRSSIGGEVAYFLHLSLDLQRLVSILNENIDARPSRRHARPQQCRHGAHRRIRRAGRQGGVDTISSRRSKEPQGTGAAPISKAIRSDRLYAIETLRLADLGRCSGCGDSR